MSAATTRETRSAWAVVSLACAGAIGLAAAVAYAYAPMADAGLQPGDLLGAPAVVLAASIWLASPLGVLSGIIAWVRSPHNRTAAGLGIALNAVPWLAMFAF